MHLGDFDASAVIYGKFSTYRPSSGATFTLGGTPALSVYKDNSTTQSTTGVTLTADFDSVTGLNHFAIDTSADGTFYSAGSFFDIVITTGTVDGVSVTGSVVARFTIRKNSALKPTTAGRTLDVSAGGEAGIDLANVGSPTTTLALTGTTIATTQKVDIETIKTQAVTAGAGVTFPASIASPTNITAGTITTATNLTNAPTAGDFTATMKTSIGTAVAASAVASVTGNVGGNVTGSVGSVASGGITAASIADGAIDRATFAADTGLLTIRSNTAQAGASTSITLDASASSTTDYYKNDLVFVTGGTGIGQSRYITAYNGTTKVATVSAWATNPDNTSTFAILPGDAIPGATAPTAADVADAVWDELLSGHAISGSAGAGLSAAGSAGDPWSTALPGSYGSGTAGKIIGDNINATVSSRAAASVLGAAVGASISADIAAVKTDTAAVKIQTDKLTFTVANQIDANVLDWKGSTAPAMTGDAFARLGAPAGASVSADVAAIQAKTTNIPASPAAVGSAMALTSGERNSVADALLDRDMATGTDSGSTTVRTVRQALRASRNKVSAAAGVLTICKEDDSTTSWTAALTTDAAAVPITAIDPAGP